MISLGADSHHPWQLEFLDLGLAAALAGGIREERILNFKTADELLAWSDRVRGRAGSRHGKRKAKRREPER